MCCTKDCEKIPLVMSWSYRWWSTRVMALKVVQTVIKHVDWVAEASHLPGVFAVVLWIHALLLLLLLLLLAVVRGCARIPSTLRWHSAYQVACIIEDAYGLPGGRRWCHLQAAARRRPCEGCSVWA